MLNFDLAALIGSSTLGCLPDLHFSRVNSTAYAVVASHSSCLNVAALLPKLTSELRIHS